MKRLIVSACVVAVAGCASDIWYTPLATEQGGFTSGSRILAHLEGRTMIMETEGIPSHPNGFDENVNFGQATQCYNRVEMRSLGGKFTVSSQLGTLNGASNTGDVGQCDRATPTAELTFDSTAVLVENVQDGGACFDFTITYPGFGQEGRGSISEDGSTVTLELFFKDQATGHRCADGAVGDRTVTLSQSPFAGEARQVYSVVEAPR